MAGEKSKTNPFRPDSKILVERVSFAYGKKPILRDIDLKLSEGTVAAVLGPNGAGKSTLLKVISGYLRPQKGEVRVNGERIHSLSSGAKSRLVTYTGSDPTPSFDFTVKETVLMGRTSRSAGLLAETAEDLKAAEDAMQVTGVFELKDRPITSLSSGELQRVWLARAICQDPQVLLLDEPTAHLDMCFKLEIMEIISKIAREKKKTVLAVFHDLNLAMRYASILLFLKDGALAYTLQPGQISAKVIEEIYNVRASLIFHRALESWCVVPLCPTHKSRCRKV